MAHFCALQFLHPQIEDCFVEDMFSDVPQDSRCEQFPEKVEDTKVKIRTCNSKKDRHYNGQKNKQWST